MMLAEAFVTCRTDRERWELISSIHIKLMVTVYSEGHDRESSLKLELELEI